MRTQIKNEMSTSQILAKKVHPGSIEADMGKKAIVVNFETIVQYGDKGGNPTEKVCKKGQKSFPIGAFKPSDIPEIADELIANCNLLTPSSKDLLCRLLDSLLTGKTLGISGDVSVEKLDSYIECLYDDLPLKIEATTHIFKLCEDANNLAAIAGHDVLISALARTLREEGTKSVQLATNIGFIFFAISHYAMYGQPLLQHRVPEALIKMIDQEDKRYRVWFAKLAQLKRDIQASDSKEGLKRQYLEEYGKFKQMLVVQDKLFFSALHTIINLSECASEGLPSIDIFVPVSKMVPLLSTILKRRPVNAQLVILTISFLKRISVMQGGSAQILKADIVQSLTKLIQKGQDEAALEPTLRLLYNLAFVDAARAEMAGEGLVERIEQYMQDLCGKIMAVLGAELRADAGKGTGGDVGEDPLLVDTLAAVVDGNNKRAETPDSEALAKSVALCARILYLIGSDDEGLRRISPTLARLCVQLCCVFPSPPLELVVLLVNIMSYERLAKDVMQAGLLQPLALQCARIPDPLFIKIFNNAALWFASFQPRSNMDSIFGHIPVIMNILTSAADDEIVYEALGAIANAPLKYLARGANILKFALRILFDSDGQEDLVLEAIRLLSTVLASEKVVFNERHIELLPKRIIGLMASRMEDYDFVVAAMFCVLRAVTHSSLRPHFLSHPDFLPFVFRFMYTVPAPFHDLVGQGAGDRPDRAKRGALGRRHHSGRPHKEAGNVLESCYKTPIDRATHLLAVISELILETLSRLDDSVAEKIIGMKFKKYNNEYINTALQKTKA